MPFGSEPKSLSLPITQTSISTRGHPGFTIVEEYWPGEIGQVN